MLIFYSESWVAVIRVGVTCRSCRALPGGANKCVRATRAGTGPSFTTLTTPYDH